MKEDVLLEMKDIGKQFTGVKALDHVNLTIHRGEVHALMGENGAGKSTLIKILSGVYKMDEGSITMDGKSVSFSDTLDAQRHGISTIYQELNMIPELSVSENIFLGRELKRRGVFINWREIDRQTERLLERVGIHGIDIHSPVRSFGTAVQQMVSIARALSIDSRLVIMDEPTSSLDAGEVKTLFQVIQNLRAQGIAVIFISHRIDEIFAICQRVTVLKDGHLVGTHNVGEISKVQLVSEMIGRDATSIVEAKAKAARRNFGEAFIHLRNAQTETKIRNVNLTVNKGQVVGLAGLLGAGRTETARLLFGMDRLESGEIFIRGKEAKLRSPREAISKGIAFCPENRRADGIVGDMSVRENITLALLPKLKKWGFVDVKKQREIVEKFVEKLGIKAASLDQPVKSLSGGNQQKVILARWMCTNPDLMILDEPTRGIDVGAKQEIEKLINELAHSGLGVLMISSELNEVIRNSDRVDVIRDGLKVCELEGGGINEQAIMRAIAEGQQAQMDRRED